MDFRKISSTILLLFLAVSLIVLVVKRFRDDAQSVSRSAAVPASSATRSANSAAPDAARKLIVYYFHGASRSEASKKVEALAHEVIQSGFTADLESGRLEWRVVDYDRPENGHFTTDYDLDAPALVMVRMRGDRQWGWDRLDEANDLAGDRPKLVELIQRQIRETLDGG